MNKLIEGIEKDIKRCEDVLLENDFLEIVIVIEELHDKYKYDIKIIKDIEKDVVWKYSKNDIKLIKQSLKDYKEKLFKEETNKNINLKINNIRSKVLDNSISNKEELVTVINNIENIMYEELSLDIKWDIIKPYLTFIQNQKRCIAGNLLEIIGLIIK